MTFTIEDQTFEADTASEAMLLYLDDLHPRNPGPERVTVSPWPEPTQAEWFVYSTGYQVLAETYHLVWAHLLCQGFTRHGVGWYKRKGKSWASIWWDADQQLWIWQSAIGQSSYGSDTSGAALEDMANHVRSKAMWQGLALKEDVAGMINLLPVQLGLDGQVSMHRKGQLWRLRLDYRLNQEGELEGNNITVRNTPEGWVWLWRDVGSQLRSKPSPKFPHIIAALEDCQSTLQPTANAAVQQNQGTFERHAEHPQILFRRRVPSLIRPTQRHPSRGPAAEHLGPMVSVPVELEATVQRKSGSQALVYCLRSGHKTTYSVRVSWKGRNAHISPITQKFMFGGQKVCELPLQVWQKLFTVWNREYPFQTRFLFSSGTCWVHHFLPEPYEVYGFSVGFWGEVSHWWPNWNPCFSFPQQTFRDIIPVDLDSILSFTVPLSGTQHRKPNEICDLLLQVL